MPNLNRGFEAGDCGRGCGGLTLAEAFGDKMRDVQHWAGGCGVVYEAKGRTNGRTGRVKTAQYSIGFTQNNNFAKLIKAWLSFNIK